MSKSNPTDSNTLAEAMRQIAILLQTEDGVVNAAITEAANRIMELERTLQRESRRLDWLINELDGWDRDNIDDAIDREETYELKREKLEADAKYDIDWEDEE